jgi:hypothetical protein
MVLVTATMLIALTGAMDGAVLTDIPRFLPEVTSSEVRERSERRAVVEQEAVSRMMMFSKKVHLITYELTAKPSFDVPEFILKRLLKRDST